MKKIIAFGILTVLSLFLLIGCNSSMTYEKFKATCEGTDGTFAQPLYVTNEKAYCDCGYEAFEYRSIKNTEWKGCVFYKTNVEKGKPIEG